MLANSIFIRIFETSNSNKEFMKSSELHRIIQRGGWKFLKQDGTSHRFYEKAGQIICVPYHGSKEMPTGTANKILKAAGIK